MTLVQGKLSQVQVSRAGATGSRNETRDRALVDKGVASGHRACGVTSVMVLDGLRAGQKQEGLGEDPRMGSPVTLKLSRFAARDGVDPQQRHQGGRLGVV